MVVYLVGTDTPWISVARSESSERRRRHRHVPLAAKSARRASERRERREGKRKEDVHATKMSLRTLSTGETLHEGRYVIRRELNRGGTAIVYEADDLERGIKVALKVMNAKNGVMTVPAKTVQREIQLASSVHHDNIVQLLAVFSDGDQVVLVWELVCGPDLLDLLNDCGGRMSEYRASSYFAQLLEGVLFLHDHGLCHRDLKPENCMIDSKTDKLKIIDFGLSKHVDSAITLGVGTPDYMPPEILSGTTHLVAMAPADGKRKYDPKAVDVWAMGVMLYLCVVGAYPFEDPNHPNNVARTLQNVRDGRIRPLPADLSSQCRDLIKSMLNRKPEKRITLQGMMHHPWLRKKLSHKLQGKLSASNFSPGIQSENDEVAAPSKPTTTKTGFHFSSLRLWGKKGDKSSGPKLIKKRSGA